MVVTTAMTVAELKVKIMEHHGMPVSDQSLYHEMKRLQDGLSLHEYNIQKHSLIIAVRAL
jgi:hypothetical protein